MPTLILHGDLDASSSIDITGRRTAEQIPDSRLVVYEGAGHGLYASDHERVNAGIFAWGEAREPVTA